WSTASTTAGAWKTPGWTGRLSWAATASPVGCVLTSRSRRSREHPMKRAVQGFAALLLVLGAASGAVAQKPGGVMPLSHFDSPASMSILEEATRATVQPMMGVFNNLVLYDQHVKRSSLESILPDLATSWSWSEDGKDLTFPLRQGVKWHDGKPFTAADVK